MDVGRSAAAVDNGTDAVLRTSEASNKLVCCERREREMLTTFTRQRWSLRCRVAIVFTRWRHTS